jgi:hypothetical protein
MLPYQERWDTNRRVCSIPLEDGGRMRIGSPRVPSGTALLVDGQESVFQPEIVLQEGEPIEIICIKESQ